MTFQEWLKTEAGRMVSFEKMPRMLEIVWNASAEAAEARAADEELRAKSWHDSAMTLADQRDAAYKRNEELEARSTDAENHNANLLREVEQWRIHVDHVEAERDELRRQLSEAQRAIDVLSNTVVAQDATIKRLEQAREDVTEYRAEIARLARQAENTPKHIQEALNEGDGVYRP